MSIVELQNRSKSAQWSDAAGEAFGVGHSCAAGVCSGGDRERLLNVDAVMELTWLFGDASPGCGAIACKAAHGLLDAGISGSGCAGVGLDKPSNAAIMEASASSMAAS